jgi:YgiT-type zinc finger domain-containing protein
MKCPMCGQVQIVDGVAQVDFERGETRLTIHNVPARLCAGCGETYVEEAVAQRLLNLADEAAAQGAREGIREYADPITR